MRDWLRRWRIKFRFWRAGMKPEPVWWEDEHYPTDFHSPDDHEMFSSAAARAATSDDEQRTECGL